jgi:four helix bundle protein
MNLKIAGSRYDLEDRLISFAVAVCRVAESLPSTRVGKQVEGQLIRSGTSVAPNYGEAQAGESRKDFVHKMRVCLKELRETLVWLKMTDNLGIGDSAMVRDGIQECDELVRIFVASIATAEQNDRTQS